VTRRTLFVSLGLSLATIAATNPAAAQAGNNPRVVVTRINPDGRADAQDALYTGDQLDNLLASVALYPDPLLAQVLLAATFPDEI
jgi:hypothetical protein